ncbi:hypothetical protein EYV94_13140 [Puteibacter caeruleilacunae]|nr:hypothetical protein EYV94_13140 [Puteibacter caeruleilacunae]
MRITIIILSLLIIFNSCVSCRDESTRDVSNTNQQEMSLAIETFHFSKANYQVGDRLVMPSFKITNESNVNLAVSELKVKLRDLENNQAGIAFETVIAGEKQLDKGASTTIESKEIWNISKDTDGAYGVYLEYVLKGEEERTETCTKYVTFIRVSSSPELNTYDITKSKHSGMSVYELTRGLSAEYSIQKAAAALEAGISHSWSLPLGPVQSTPQFLEQSIKKTIDFYDANLGENTTYETVVISSGIPSAVYLANTMHATLLPLHYLVGAGTVKEVETILDYSNKRGYSSYATLGHDFSISETIGVAWVKLLDIPQEYIDFINRHKVKNIVFLGFSGSAAGEVQARKVMDERGKYDPESLYIMHFAGDMAETYLRKTIRDFDQVKKAAMTSVADWESGIIPEQSANFSRSLKEHTSVENINLLTSNSDIALWDLGAYLMLAYMDKNKNSYGSEDVIKGITLNPYLIAHPFYETRMGYIPFLYWQTGNAAHHIDTRMATKIKDAVLNYFPETKFNELEYWVNSTHNFGGGSQGAGMAAALRNKNYSHVYENNFAADETWNLKDGLQSPVEKRCSDLLSRYSADELHIWKQQLKALNPDDLRDMSTHYSEIDFIQK